MNRRGFLVGGAMTGLGAIAARSAVAQSISSSALTGARMSTQSSAPAIIQRRPIQIRMGGYGPATTGFSLALKRIGDQLTAKFGKEIEVKYVYNIMDLGYRGEDILWLVESGVLTLGYQSSSYMTDRVPELGVADLPFLFASDTQARAAMDGDFGRMLTEATERQMDYRILGYFENGFRHISNRLRPVRTPADLKGMKIRVLPSKIQARTFELLGADPKIMDLTEAIKGVIDGTLDAQENPFLNTVTYGVHKYHRYHTATRHFYLSRPIFFHRASFDAWPKELQEAMRSAVREAVTWQRESHIREEDESAAIIRQAGGEILELTAAEQKMFVEAVAPLHREARSTYDPKLLAAAGLR